MREVTYKLNPFMGEPSIGRAWFHGWAGTSERAYALLENKDTGEMITECFADDIQFVFDPDELPYPAKSQEDDDA